MGLSNVEVIDKWGSEVLEIHSAKGMGSAFPVKIDGKKMVVSAAHVCRHHNTDSKGKPFMSSYYGGKSWKLKVLKIFKTADICFLQHPEGMTYFKIAPKVKRHDEIYAVGYTLREISDDIYVFPGLFKHNSTMEWVQFEEDEVKSCLKDYENSKVELRNKLTMFGPATVQACVYKRNVYVTTARGSGGISGGPTFNDDGEIVGINMLTINRINALVLVPGYEIVRYFRNKDKLK